MASNPKPADTPPAEPVVDELATDGYLTYVGPFDVVEIFGVGVVERLSAFPCDAVIAGRGPYVEIEKGTHTDPEGNESEVDVEVSYPGDGLLAQVDNFRAATPAEVKKMKGA